MSMIKIIHKTKLLPDFIASSILDIDAHTLQNFGITHLMFDLDDTLVYHGNNEIPPEYSAQISQLTEGGFTVLIGTNTKRDLNKLATDLDVTILQPIGLSYKPLKSYYKRAVSAAGTTPDHIAMIGDRLINDVVGANRSNFLTVLVQPLSSNLNLFLRLYLRSKLRRS